MSTIIAILYSTTLSFHPSPYIPFFTHRGSKRAFLKSRTNKVDLEGKLGSTEIIDPAAASATKSNLDTTTAALTPSSGVSKCSDGVGWHCRVCDCFLKDSLTYLDHINGKKHQRFLGYTMRVEKSTTEEVGGLLSSLGEKKRERENAILGGGGAAALSETVDFEDVVRKKDEEALRRKAERARRREERKRTEREEVNGSAAVQLTHTVRDNNIAAEEEKKEDAEIQVGDNNPAEDEEGDDEEEEAVIDPALAAMMGISGFGSSKK